MYFLAILPVSYTHLDVYKRQQEELFELWLKQLDETINYLRENNPQDVLGAQDFIYRGKLDKWAKLANSLKLRIAARLINKDKARAIAIVNEAAQNPAGLILTLDDDFVFNKGKRDNNWNNDISVGAGTKQLIDFMVSNRDPRLFYFFQKNDYNSNVVQGFFDQKRALPSYVCLLYTSTATRHGKRMSKIPERRLFRLCCVCIPTYCMCLYFPED